MCFANHSYLVTHYAKNGARYAAMNVNSFFFVQMWFQPDFKNMFMYAIGGIQAVIGRQ